MKRLGQLRELLTVLAFTGLVFYAGGVTPLGRAGYELAALLIASTVAAEWFATGQTALPNRFALTATWGFVGYLLVRSLYPQPSSASLEEAMYWITGVMLYTALVHHFHDRQRLERMIAAMALVALVAAAVGLGVRYQGEGAEPAGPALWHLTGTYVNRNHFALLLVTLMPVTYYAGIAFRSPSATADRPWEHPWFLFFLSATLLVAFLLTGSVGGFMAFCVAAVIIGLDFALHRTSGSRRRYVEAAAGAALIFTLTFVWFGGDFLAERLSRAATGREVSAIERVRMWEAALQMLRDHPAFGIGPGQFANWFPAYRPAEIPYRVDHVHNDVLELAAETGAVGGLLLLASLTLYFIHVFSSRNEIRSTYDRAMVRGGTVSLAAVFVHSLVDFGLRLPANAFAVTCVLAAVTASASHRQSDEESKLRLSGWKRFAAATAPLAMMAIFGWLSVSRAWSNRQERRAAAVLESDPALALSLANEAAGTAPLTDASTEILRAKALTALAAGQPEELARATRTEIAAAYTKAVTLEPKVAAHYRARAKWLRETGDASASQADLIRAVELSPHDWRPLYELCLSQWAGGDTGAAILNFGLLLKERPDLIGSVLRFIASDPARHRQRLASLYPVLSEALPQTAQIRIVFADHLGSFGLKDEARAQYEVAAIADPDNVNYLLRLVDALRAAGDYNGAIYRLDAFHEHSKGTPGSYEARGDLARLNQEVADAVAAYRKALDLEPDRPDTWKKLYDAYVEFQADPGLKYWQDLTEKFPDRSIYRYLYAQQLMRSSSTLGEAVRELRLIAGREPSNWLYVNTLAELHIRRRLHEEARRVWADYAEKVPSDPRPWESIARMYDGLKLPDRAAEARQAADNARKLAAAPAQ